MVDKLKNIQKILTGFTYTRDIEDIVFDNNGQKYTDPNKCAGKRVIDGYNSQTVTANNNNFKYFGRTSGLDKEIFNITDTKYFSLGYYRSQDNNSTGVTITTYYFKEIIIIEEQQVCLRPNPPQYRGFRHYFTPDILLFLKHFHRPERTEQGIDYVRQNPHYFKHHTVDSIEIFKKANETIKEIVEEHNTKLEYYEQLEKKVKDLENEKELLQQTIKEMEEKASSPIKIKQE